MNETVSVQRSRIQRFKGFLDKIKGTHFYLIPIGLTVTYAIIAYLPIDPILKLGFVSGIGIVVVLSVYLWIVSSDVPKRSRELMIKEIELTAKEEDIKYLETIVERIPVDVRYREFNREVCIDATDGSSDQTWNVIVENVSKNRNLTRLDIPSKRFDAYDQLDIRRPKLKKANPNVSDSRIEEMAFKEIEYPTEVIVGEKILEKGILEGLISDFTIHRRRFSKSGAYYDELSSEGEVAEVTYTVPLEGQDAVQPGQTKRIVLKAKNACAYRNVMECEAISARVNKLYDETTMTITCKPGFVIQRVSTPDTPTGLKVVDIATHRLDETELGRVSGVYIDQDRRKLVWKILKPKIGYVYIMRFKLSKV